MMMMMILGIVLFTLHYSRINHHRLLNKILAFLDLQYEFTLLSSNTSTRKNISPLDYWCFREARMVLIAERRHQHSYCWSLKFMTDKMQNK